MGNPENSSFVLALNEVLQDLSNEFDKVVYRDGSFGMTGDLDMGSQEIFNLPPSSAVVQALPYVDPRNYGILTTNQSAALAALQAAVNEASSSGKPLHIPSDSSMPLRINGTVIVPSGGISIIGGGSITSTVDLPVFKLTGASFHQTYSDFEVKFELSGAMPVHACAIELASNGPLIERNTFQNIHSIGAIATIISTSATRTTEFGQESAVNWNVFNNISNLEAVRGDARNVYWSKAGSGTGNTFLSIMGQLGAPGSAFVRFDGTGCVVGDIIVSGAHTSAGLDADPDINNAIDCAVVEVGDNTIYRSNIQVVGCQTDSRVKRVFRLAPVSVAVPNSQGVIQVYDAGYYNIRHDGSLIGGATTLGINVPVATMRMDDRDAGVWSGGGYWGTTATGLQTLPVCKVTMAALFGGVRLRLHINGLVGGVAGGNTVADISLNCDGSTITATTVSNSPVPAGIFNVSFSGTGLVKTINITFSPTQSPSKGHVTWEAIGNDFFLERLI